MSDKPEKPSPQQLAREERERRWAMRDQSPFPLTEAELAERSHDKQLDGITEWLHPGPFVAAVLLALLFQSWLALAGGAVACLAARILAEFNYTLAHVFGAKFAKRYAFTCAVLGFFQSAIALVALALIKGAAFAALTAFILQALVLMLWPFIWLKWRQGRETDLQRIMREGQSPAAPIIE